MRELIPYFINGISVGGQYALIAIGYTLVYGILRLINFAHGDVFMVAGLVMVYATTAMPFYIALPLVLVVTVVLGFLIERVAYKPLRTAPRMSVMISAIGVSYLIQNLAFYITGGVPQPVSNPIPWISENVSILGTSTKRVTLVTPVLTILLVIVLIRIKYTTYSSMWASALVNIPGTILHEMMHYIVGLVLNARPCNFTIFPRKSPDGYYVMGSVGFRNVTFYNAVPSAMAPLLLLVIGFYLNRYYLPLMRPTMLNYVLYVLLQTIIIENAMPSGADFRVAGMYLKGILLYGFLLVALLVFM